MASNIPWQSDGEYEYFIIKDNEFTCEVSKENSEIYLHEDKYRNLDHFFIRVDDERGFFCWRELVNKVLGVDKFEDMVEEMADHDIEVIFQEEPSQSDIEEWE